MAYYEVIFEGQTYASRDLYMDALKVGALNFSLLQRVKLVLGVPIFGPLSSKEKSLCRQYHPTVQNIDEQMESLVFTLSDNERQIVVNDKDVLLYKGKEFVRLSAIKDAKRYRLQSKMAIVKICGRGMFVCLDAKHKDAVDYVVFTRKK